MPIFLSYRRGQPEPQLNPSCISREILVQESLGWETESISQLCSLWEGVGGQGSLQRTHPAEEGTEIILLESLKRLEVTGGGRGDSLGIEVQTNSIPEGFREKVIHRPNLLGGGTDQRKI